MRDISQQSGPSERDQHSKAVTQYPYALQSDMFGPQVMSVAVSSQVKRAFENIQKWAKPQDDLDPRLEHCRAVFRWALLAQCLREARHYQAPSKDTAWGSTEDSGCNSQRRRMDGIFDGAAWRQGGPCKGTGHQKGGTKADTGLVTGNGEGLTHPSHVTGLACGSGCGMAGCGMGASRHGRLCEAHLGFASGDGSFDFAGTERPRSAGLSGLQAGSAESSVLSALQNCAGTKSIDSKVTVSERSR